jgi:hypothetical protein
MPDHVQVLPALFCHVAVAVEPGSRQVMRRLFRLVGDAETAANVTRRVDSARMEYILVVTVVAYKSINLRVK